MVLIRLIFCLSALAMVASCANQAGQTNNDATSASDVLSPYQAEQQIQGIAIENAWVGLLEVCDTYTRTDIPFEDSEDAYNLSPNCFLKAGEICNADDDTSIQHDLLEQRFQNIRQTACALWQPYDQKIWQEDSRFSQSRYKGPCFEAFAYLYLRVRSIMTLSFDTISAYEELCQQRELSETQSNS